MGWRPWFNPRDSMFRPLRHIFDRTIRIGHLTLIDADGRNYSFGDRSGDPVVARITDKRTERQIALNPALAVGEAYMDGRLIIEQGTIYDFLEVILANLLEDVRFVTRRLQ
jgi:cyclopropane-fatty-acyl-phospholipid synthase